MRGALVTRSSDLTGLTFPVTPINFNNEVYDTDSLWDVGSPGRFTIPSGVTAVRVHLSLECPNNGAAGSMFASINKNGSTVVQAVNHARFGTIGFSDNVGFSLTPILAVSAGDYFEGRLNISGIGGPTSIIAGLRTFFSIEIIE